MHGWLNCGWARRVTEWKKRRGRFNKDGKVYTAKLSLVILKLVRWLVVETWLGQTKEYLYIYVGIFSVIQLPLQLRGSNLIALQSLLIFKKYYEFVSIERKREW